LGYILSDSAYDVWISNSRGNKYSLKHSHWSTETQQFWNFDFDSHAKYDIPASIHTALTVSGQTELTLISHSQGATASLIALTTVPGLHKKVSLFVALAPVTMLKHQQSSILSGLAKFNGDKLLLKLGNREIVPTPDNLAKILGETCSILSALCRWEASTLFGPSTHIQSSRTGVYANHWPDRTSTKNMRHWIQNARSGNFNSMDQTINYELQIHTMQVPTAIFSGSEDKLGDTQDIASLVASLTQSKQLIHNKIIPGYSHMDFTWAQDAAKFVYQDILTLVGQYSATAPSKKKGKKTKAKTMAAFDADEAQTEIQQPVQHQQTSTNIHVHVAV